GRPLPPGALVQDSGQRFKLTPDSVNGVGVVHCRVMADQRQMANPNLATLLFRGPLVMPSCNSERSSSPAAAAGKRWNPEKPQRRPGLAAQWPRLQTFSGTRPS